MTDPTPDAALKIARWCWPKTAEFIARDMGIVRLIEADGGYRDWCVYLTDHVHAAELVLIERGHAHQYGKELQATFTERARTKEEAVAWIATASLDARCRAILSTIDSYERSQTDPG